MNAEVTNLHGQREVQNKLDWQVAALPDANGYELRAQIRGDLVSSVLNMKLPPTMTLDTGLDLELEAAAWCLLGVSLANKIILKPELKSALVAEIKEHCSWMLGTDQCTTEDGCTNKP